MNEAAVVSTQSAVVHWYSANSGTCTVCISTTGTTTTTSTSTVVVVIPVGSLGCGKLVQVYKVVKYSGTVVLTPY
jgi:hypothetical protein